ncbi:hypothetical protein ACFQI3_13100 [Hansschlegelia quercus]|uniref:Uncharacterized protein n=1 Tax=Hansschlegelia quercus TaxID=2528245 RepID=A0A4Q9GHD8_9HYPH|nr:hypothetical protein [Hansschlegelia quercus]TBN48003.1 hypothetical protein EYR15_15435 [Hansschlegelia quercus]
MASTEEFHFDGWLKAAFAETGAFTALVVLVDIGRKDATPVASTFFHVIGDEADWAEMSRLFAGAPNRWNGAAFFAETARDGGPLDEPLARIELRRVEQMIDDDRMALNEAAFFNRKGQRLRIDEDGDSA